MPILRFQVLVPAVSAFPEDTIVNTWHFSATGTSEGILSDIKGALAAFYEDWDAYKSGLMNWASTRVKVYNMDEAEPRVPIDDTGLTLTSAPAGTAAPELAVCLSYAADYVSGSSTSRRRGRIYCGPLNSAAMNTTTGQLNSTAQTAFVTAGTELLTASGLASDWVWVVYSRTNDQGYPVTNGWVDNALDVQRRRGLSATVRTTFG